VNDVRSLCEDRVLLELASEFLFKDEIMDLADFLLDNEVLVEGDISEVSRQRAESFRLRVVLDALVLVPCHPDLN
jgi:hypothetical protein